MLNNLILVLYIIREKKDLNNFKKYIGKLKL